MLSDIGDLAKAIQLALAPVFLLTGIAALLGVMTGRLARIIDRGRAFAEGRVASVTPNYVSIALERQTLEPRRHMTSIAISATTMAALLVCVVIAGLFIEVMLETPLKWLISASFAAAMFALVVGLMFFLREVHLAMRTVRIPVHKDKHEVDEQGYAPVCSKRRGSDPRHIHQRRWRLDGAVTKRKPMFRLNRGKNAFVSGAAHGIDAAIAADTLLNLEKQALTGSAKCV